MTDHILYSVHSFLFPFRWDFIAENIEKEMIPFSLRTNLDDFNRIFSKCNTLKRTPFKIGMDRPNYNEFSYFHDYALRALYDLGNETNHLKDHEILYYEINGNEGDFYKIKILNGNEYTLFPDSICMHIYSTGVGVLTLNLMNSNYSEPEDILQINEFGRRIYPQYLKPEGIETTKGTFLADKIEGKIGDITFYEDFNQYDRKLDIESTFLPPDFIKKFFGFKIGELEGIERAFVFRKSHERKGNIRISRITDDRMFYICCYQNGELASKMAEEQIDGHEKQYHYQKDPFWFAFTFGDKEQNDISIKYTEIQKSQLKKHSYLRWIDYKNPGEFEGTLYGLSRNSFVCLSGWSDSLIHMQTMYYQMCVLCLAQRASVLRFAYEVSNITNILEENANPSGKIKDLYKNYIQFINKIYFREITSQLQGNEIYKQFQEVMNLEKDVKDLDIEISEFHTYVSIWEQSNLSKVATWFLPASVIAGILCANVIFIDRKTGFIQNQLAFFMWLGVVVVSTLITIWIINKYLYWRK